MATAKGVVKKSNLKDFDNVRRSGLVAIKLGKDDKLGWVKPTTGNDVISITTAFGQAIKFKESDVRAMGRGAAGVKGIRLKENDQVVGANIVNTDDIDGDLIITSEKGQIIRIPLKSIPVLGRATQGVRVMRPQAGDKVSASAVL